MKTFIEKAGGRKVFLEHEVKGLMKAMGFPVPRGRFIRKGEGIMPHDELPFPLVAKVSSSAIASKSDVHGIRIGLKSEEELAVAVADLMSIEGAEGVLVEEMAPPGLEVVVGGTSDGQFGPIVMFGLGGIFVELFKDIAFALAPLKKDEALWLVRAVKGYRLLEGYRGSLTVDLKSLTELLVGISELMATGLIEEIDLNPVALYPEGAMILDAKMLAALSSENAPFLGLTQTGVSSVEVS
ncbi:MAG TPA: acetate--CoA ligase family protein [Thermodesulfovibrionales bacterium]|nr:acetate--CoA ligase family protein [Thermodesulfovibrionales bacterium]